METLDGVRVIVVEGEVHRLIHPLLRGRLGQSHFSLEDAIALIGDGGIASADVAADVHGNGQDGDGFVGCVDGDACHAVGGNGESSVAGEVEGAVAIVVEG